MPKESTNLKLKLYNATTDAAELAKTWFNNIFDYTNSNWVKIDNAYKELKDSIASSNEIITIQKSLQVTTDWMDTGIKGTDLKTGTYIVQITGFTYSNMPGIYGEIWSGIMTWYSDETNNGESDEIFLHKAGHAPNQNDIYLRTQRRTRGSGNLSLQISSVIAATASDTVTFKFRKII